MTAFAGKVVWMTGAGTGIGKAGALNGEGRLIGEGLHCLPLIRGEMRS